MSTEPSGSACTCACTSVSGGAEKPAATGKPSYYITTPIYYVNAKPHLGTAYSTLLCDTQARFRRMDGYDVKFLTGTDEHGQKVAQSAKDHGMTAQQWCDSMVPGFKELWRELEISNDVFMRTTEERHTRSVQHLWDVLRENGHIYKSRYEGWYCIPEETYFTDTDVRHAPANKERPEAEPVCPDCGRPLSRVQEESWFFKLSEFQQPLLDFYDAHPDFVSPEIRYNEVRSFVEGGLKDLSITRTSFDWGIPLPFDPEHVTYVWFDALINYLTAAGYGDSSEAGRAELAKRWPAQIHVVGKDIIRFHCVIWPAMLMAAGIELPEKVLAHGFLLVRGADGKGEKMSKSRGNAIAPEDVIQLLGVEGYRYFFMTEIAHGSDGAISYERMIQVYNADLANNWGNLVSRSLNMAAKYFDGKAPVRAEIFAGRDCPMRTLAQDIYARHTAAMEDFDYSAAAAGIMELIDCANKFIEERSPWSLAKDPANAGELAFVIWSLLEAVRLAAQLLWPITPATSAEVMRRLGLDTEPGDNLRASCTWGLYEGGFTVEKGGALFPRLDAAAIEKAGL